MMKNIFKNSFLGLNYSASGLKIELQRKTIGVLASEFFIPTGIFAMVSMLSFLIDPKNVPGRMGLIVTLLLISSNVYSSINAPSSRGFSYIEAWIVGSQTPIIFALAEYGVILLVTKYFKSESDLLYPYNTYP